MSRLFRRRKVRVYYFTDKTSDENYDPSSYKDVAKAISAGHEVVAEFHFERQCDVFTSSKILWIHKHSYKTERRGNVYNYYRV